MGHVFCFQDNNLYCRSVLIRRVFPGEAQVKLMPRINLCFRPILIRIDPAQKIRALRRCACRSGNGTVAVRIIFGILRHAASAVCIILNSDVAFYLLLPPDIQRKPSSDIIFFRFCFLIIIGRGVVQIHARRFIGQGNRVIKEVIFRILCVRVKACKRIAFSCRHRARNHRVRRNQKAVSSLSRESSRLFVGVTGFNDNPVTASHPARIERDVRSRHGSVPGKGHGSAHIPKPAGKNIVCFTGTGMHFRLDQLQVCAQQNRYCLKHRNFAAELNITEIDIVTVAGEPQVQYRIAASAFTIIYTAFRILLLE